MAKDYLVQIRIKNGPLMRAMRSSAGFTTTRNFAAAASVSYTILVAYLSLKYTPVNMHGDWRKSALDIATYLHVQPEDLFPSQHRRKALKHNSGEVEASIEDIAAYLPGAGYEADPQLALEKSEQLVALDKVLSVLSPRERMVLDRRFGLTSGREETLDEIGVDIGNVTRERVRQLENKALRRLKHPHYRLIIEGKRGFGDGWNLS